MGGVVKAVTAPVRWVGESISDVAELAVDDILKPVVDVATGVAQGMIDDPFTTVATIAALSIPGVNASFAIPLIQGASTAAKGGDIKDIALAVGASYAGGKIGKYVGGTVANQLGENAVSEIASKAAAGAARGAITAVATGGDVAQSALLAAANAGGSAAFAMGVREGVDALSAGDVNIGVGSGAEDTESKYFSSEAFVETFNAATKSVGIELKNIVEKWDDLPEIGKDIIKSSAGATISSLAITGQAPTSKQLASAITSAAIASKSTADVLSGQTGISDKAAAQITQVISDVSRTAYTGADPYRAYQVSMSNTFQPELFKAIDDITEGGLDAVFDAVSGSTTAYEEALTNAEESGLQVNSTVENVREKIKQVEDLRDGKVNITGIEQPYGIKQREQDRDIYNNSGG